VELLRALGARAEVNFTIEVVPWRRAQRLVGRFRRKAMIIPLTRIKKRESSYDWVVPLLSDPVTLVGRDPELAEMTFEEARDWLVAAQAESSHADLLSRAGFQRVETVFGEAQAARLLQQGRIDAWFTPMLVAKAVYARIGGDAQSLVAGPTRQTPPFYLAAGKGRFSEELCARLRTAFVELRIDGTYDRIVGAY